MKYLLFVLILINTRVFAQNPFIKVIDTDFSKGRLTKVDTITLEDVVKFHGHLCDGLALGFIGLQSALYQLYPDSIVDRTNNNIVSKSSPCITDIAIYLSGSRMQFNTFYVSDSIPFLFIVQRNDNLKTIGIKLKPGIKPTAMDSLGLLANKGLLNACELEKLRKQEDQFTEFLLSSNAQDVFQYEAVNNFTWNPIIKTTFSKTDVLNKKQAACKEK